MAVTDSTGQNGPWSDQLIVTYDGIVIIYLSSSFHKMFVTTVPGRVSFIVQLQLTDVDVIWQVYIMALIFFVAHYIFPPLYYFFSTFLLC